ncbi:MAG: hypothetical protein AAFO95_11915 [Cyanobacteria bacterium J06600_6]
MSRIYNLNLTLQQQVAKKIGAVDYRGYKCSSCSNALHPYSLFRYPARSLCYRECPKCLELTIPRTKTILQRATQNSMGILLIRDKCHCCNYLQEKTEVIPRLPRTQTSNRSRNDSSSDTDFSCNGGSSDDGFGGGSSDGGGAGGDW